MPKYILDIPDGADFPTRVTLLAAIVILQFVSAANWAHGVPDGFINPDHVPMRRRATDRDLPTCQK